MHLTVRAHVLPTTAIFPSFFLPYCVHEDRFRDNYTGIRLCPRNRLNPCSPGKNALILGTSMRRSKELFWRSPRSLMQPYSIVGYCGQAHSTEVSHKTHFDFYKSRVGATALKNPIHRIPPIPSKCN